MFEDLYQAFLRYAADWVFWAVSIGAAIGIWWVLSLAFARLYYSSNPNQARPAARSGILTGFILTVTGIAISTWFIWHELYRMISSGVISLVALAIVTIVVFALDQEE